MKTLPPWLEKHKSLEKINTLYHPAGADRAIATYGYNIGFQACAELLLPLLLEAKDVTNFYNPGYQRLPIADRDDFCETGKRARDFMKKLYEFGI